MALSVPINGKSRKGITRLAYNCYEVVLMLLSELLRMNSVLTVEYLQKAYQYVVEKLRLDPQLIPIRLTGRVQWGRWDLPFTDSVGNQFVVKEIQTVINGKLVSTPVYKEYINGVVGSIGSANYGWSNTELMTVDGDEFVIVDKTLECTSSDDCLCMLQCYAYPVFVYPSGLTSAQDKTLFTNIADAVATYSINTLTVDPGLMMMVGPMALAYYHYDAMSIGLAKTLEHYVVQLINYYNKQKHTFVIESFDGKRRLKGGSL